MNIQLSSIFVLLAAGMVFGVIYDFYRVLRGKIIDNKGRSRARSVNFIGDLCFWGFVFLVVTPFIFWGTWLELRLYVWLALLVGVGLYFGIFSSILIPWILCFWRILTWAPRQISMAIWQFRIFLKKLKGLCK